MSDAWLAGPVTTVAYGWRLERSDGVTIGFTSHDADVMLDGIDHRSSPGMVPSSILSSAGLETDGLEVQGHLDNDAIRADDLEAGRWNRARVHIYLFDWSDPSQGKRILAMGELGEVRYSSAGFQADLRGLAALLDSPVVPQTSPTCRATFCDADCGLSAQRFCSEVTIESVFGDKAVCSVSLPDGAGVYASGRLRWLEGGNCGLWSDILEADGNQLLLVNPPAFPVTIPARAALFEGCDKTIATCANRFANAVNFRGEPYLPGNDLLTRYPGAG